AVRQNAPCYSPGTARRLPPRTCSSHDSSGHFKIGRGFREHRLEERVCIWNNCSCQTKRELSQGEHQDGCDVVHLCQQRFHFTTSLEKSVGTMECIENPVESVEKFEHERELLNKMESLSNMIDLEGIAESNAKDVVSVVSSTEPGTKKELNGNLSPEFMSMPISKVSNYELEPYSGHALLEPDLNINSGDMEYSDISSCSDTEPNLDGKSSSPIEPAICANEETQPFEGVDQNVRNSVDFLLEISPSTLKEISEPCPKQDAEPQVTADETTVDVNHMNGDCNDEPPLTNADTPCGELQRVDDLKCAEDELVKDIISSDFVHSDELGSAQSCSTSGLDCTNDISSTLSSEIKTVDCLSVYQLENTSDIETSTTTQGTSEICNMDENVPCTIQVESTDLEIESRDKAENPEHGNGSPGICQLEINQQVLGDTLFNTDPGNPTDERKCLTSEEHVERGSFGFLETCFGLNNKSQNAEEHLQEVSGSTLDSQPDPPVLQKIVLDSHIQNCGLNDLLHDPPVLSAMLMSRAFDSGLKNYSYASFKSSKRKLQPVVLIKTTEQKTCDGDKYQCSTCGESAPSVDELIEHNHRRHSVHTHQLCPTCDCYFTGDSFNGHPCGKTHTLPTYAKELPVEKAIFVCRHMGVHERKRKPNLPRKEAPQKVVKNEEEFKCLLCKKDFGNPKALSEHCLIHIPAFDVSKCPFCKTTCTNHNGLIRHIRIHTVRCRGKRHLEVRIEKMTLEDLKRSSSKQFIQDDKLQCKECSKTFLNITALRRHISMMHRIQDHYMNKMKFQCEACPRRFKQLGQLKVHERLHSGDKPYGCANCGVHFIRRDYLQRHLAKCHGRGQIRDKTHHILANHRSDQSQLSDGKQQLLEVNMPQVKKEEAVDWQRPKPSNESLKCPKCEKKFSCPKQFGQHICKHNRSHPYSCLKCSVGFCSKKAMDKHRRKCKGLPVVSNHNSARHHSADEESSQADRVLVFNKGSNATGTGVLQTKFLCKDEEDNKSAEKKDAPHKYQCSECDQSFTNGLSLISHLEQHGREDQVLRTEGHKCNICNKVFTQVGVLQKHLKVQHKTKKSYSCTICSKCFRFPCDLESHKSRHDTNCPYVCDICEYRFPSQKSLTVHQGLSHGPTHLPNSHVKRSGVYRCEPCGRSYSLKGSYTKHCRLKHGNADQTNGEPKKPSVDLSPGTEKQGSDEDESAADFENDSDNDSDSAPYFPCHVCGKTFPTSESLEDHQRCHLGEKPFECEECGKCFLHLTSLQHHQRCHKSEFQCRLCGKGFVSLFSLRKHKQGHMRKGAFQCTKCSLSFTRASYLTEHMAFHKDENFPCDLCEETFSCKTSRAEHRKVHSEQEKLPPLIPPKQPETQKEPPANYSKSTSRNDREQHKLRCGICQGRFPDPEQLSEHGCNSAKERPYSCPECNKHFLHGSHLKKHQLSHQLSAGRGYQCNHCSMRFTHHHLFLNHLQSHNTEKASHSSKFPNTDETNKFAKIYQCPICPLSFYQALDLANHLSVHSHMCAVCNMTFPTQNDLDEHEQCHLTAATQYECTECGDDFIGSDAFRKHRCINPNTRVAPPVLFSKKRSSKSQFQADEEEDVDVGEDFIICPICKQRFSSNSSLMEHHKKHHEVSRPFKCLVCEKTFSQKRYLTQHQQTHNARPYKCTVCSESFKTETSLAYHSKLHDPKRQYHCPICNRNYLTEKDLSKHKLKHVQREDNREYRCDMCYKSFTMFAQLQKHQETHVGQVVYECTECDKAFAFLNLLEEHQRTHAASSAESLQSHSPSTSPY
ncbi:hypothetical protein DNTS_021622, partial [Danionella cerebrum]